jgi:hypothetical protein
MNSEGNGKSRGDSPNVFSECLRRGEDGERFVLEAFRNLYGYDTFPENNRTLQKLGIDAYLRHPKKGLVSLQIKTCSRVHETRRMFFDIEVVSGERVTQGWSFTTIAQRIVYVSEVTKEAWFFDTVLLKERLPVFRSEYRLIEIPNQGKSGLFVGRGIAVPVELIERHCQARKLALVKRESVGA